MNYEGERVWSVEIRVRKKDGVCYGQSYYQQGIKPTELDAALAMGAHLQFWGDGMGIGYGDYRVEEITIKEV